MNSLSLTIVLALLRADSPATPAISFQKEIAPIFIESCVACHNQKTKRGKYDMSSFATIMKGGGKGKAIIPGKPDESLLAQMMHGTEEPAMPKDADPLPAAQLAKIDAWIAAGAPYDGADRAADIRETQAPKKARSAKINRPTPISALAFSPDGKRFAVSGYHAVRILDAATGKVVLQGECAGERVHAVAFSPDGRMLVHAGGTPGRLGEVVLWNADTMASIATLLRVDDVQFAVAFSPDGKSVAAGGADRLFRVFDVARKKETQKAENHADWILSLSFSADGRKLLTASRDKSTKVWDLQTQESLLTFAGATDGVYGAHLAPDGKLAVSAGADNHLRVWKPESETPQVHAINAHGNTIFAARFSPSGKWVATCGGDGVVRLWDPASAKLVRAFEGHKDYVYSLAISADEKEIAAGGFDGRLLVWNLGDGKLLRTLTPDSPAPLANATPGGAGR